MALTCFLIRVYFLKCRFKQNKNKQTTQTAYFHLILSLRNRRGIRKQNGGGGQQPSHCLKFSSVCFLLGDGGLYILLSSAVFNRTAATYVQGIHLSNIYPQQCLRAVPVSQTHGQANRQAVADRGRRTVRRYNSKTSFISCFH